MVRSHGSCVQPSQQVFVERSVDRDVGISCQEAHMQLPIIMDSANIAKIVRGTFTDPIAEIKYLCGNMLKKKHYFSLVKVWMGKYDDKISFLCVFFVCVCIVYVCLLPCSNICTHVLICICRLRWRQGQREEKAILMVF